MKNKIEKIRPVLQWFSVEMEEKLSLNDHKGGWRDCEVDVLIDKMDGEIEELKEVWWQIKNDYSVSEDKKFLLEIDKEDLIKECADVANFSMMVADIMNNSEVS